MSSFRADLHMHSTCSDGSLTPVELVGRAKQIGLAAISITDHDTIDAYPSAIAEAKKIGIRIGTGVEFSCAHRGTSVHLLGYDYLLDSPDIAALCARHRERRSERNSAILKKLKALKMPIDESELGTGKTVGRPHIAEAMVKRGYVKSLKEAFHRFLAEGKRAYDPGPLFAIEEAIDVIHRAGGKAFLAHPHLLRSGRLVKELLLLPLDGIECYYARCSPDQERKWIQLAQQKGLLMSGGSDFHGEFKEIPMGSSWVGEEAFHKIFQRPF